MNAKDGNFSASDLRNALAYDPITGLLTWKKRSGKYANAVRAGMIAGYKENNGYIRIAVFGRLYQAHRLAWPHFYGEWPPCHIDHKDRNKENNSIDNLRLASDSQNCYNRGPLSNNVLGIKGVQIHKQSGKYRARIFIDGKHVSLGLFWTAEEAAIAYSNAARKVCGEFAGD